MPMDPVEVTARLTNDKVQFAGVARDNATITCDYYPPFGDGQGYTGLELLLVSLAACSGTAVVGLLRKMRKEVAGFSIHARGIRREQHPTAFTHITLDFTLTSPDAREADLQQAITLAEASYCPVWAMLKGNVEINTVTHVTVPVG